MSLSALLTAVRNHLRSELDIKSEECDCQPDGQPQPAFGSRYIAVHPTSWTPGDTRIDHGIDELFGVTCTITIRVSAVPRDRLMGEKFLKSLTGIEALARATAAVVHQNYDVMNAANAMIGGDHKLMQPLFWNGTQMPPRMETGTWVWSTKAAEMDLVAALVLPVRFGNARRIQSYAQME